LEIKSSASLVREMKKVGIKPNKALGQNFIIDDNILTKTILASEINKKSGVLEIGPGLGALTHRLSQHALKVVSIELDGKLANHLGNSVLGYGNIKIIHADALKCDLNKIIAENFEGAKVFVVANLPYYITTPLIMKLLEEGLPISSATVMVQNEVAKRIVASHSTADYSAFSIACQFYSAPKVMFTVPPSAFYPPPKVTSAVVRLDVEGHTKPIVADERKFFKVVKAAFGQRRKTLVNALGSSFDMPKAQLKQLVSDVCGNENIRGENLDISKFIKISELIF